MERVLGTAIFAKQKPSNVQRVTGGTLNLNHEWNAYENRPGSVDG
jgi:hypothetical protein